MYSSSQRFRGGRRASFNGGSSVPSDPLIVRPSLTDTRKHPTLDPILTYNSGFTCFETLIYLENVLIKVSRSKRNSALSYGGSYN